MKYVHLSCLALLGTHLLWTQDTTSILKVPEKVMAARLLTTVPPESVSKPKCSDAMATLDVIIGQDGKVNVQKVMGGRDEVTKSAIAAVKQWTYKPYMQDGITIAVETTVRVYYPDNDGKPRPFIAPDGKGGTVGGDLIPRSPNCGPPITIN